ncbi:hypothetical protein ACFQ48_17320 [Hymenobacter caeli]|uniref:Outer membrane protein beta-barrel domain-containing protein n=1 Tax=Hymenobacter caeli TaxID=2735894 RepID=A0ABX2FWG3_9BACT|nr:hypothetical protein [Hymenobacter caeli]NRT20747.1 hypothetical protein [Hymenobacter caeli]
MKKQLLMTALLGFSLPGGVYAQADSTATGTVKPAGPPTPVEVMAGNVYLRFQMIVTKQFTPTSKLGFFNVTALNGNYRNDLPQNEAVLQGMLTYRLAKRLAGVGGFAFNSVSGFRPTAGLQYVFANPKFLAILLPRFDLTQTHDFETLALLEYRTPLTPTLGLYAKAQGLYNYNIKADLHDRSYLYLRLGVSYKGFQFGPAASFDRYGPFLVATQNYGAFIGTEFR